MIASLMPGLRQLRTPLAIGVLWLGFIFIVCWPIWTEIQAAYPFFARAVELVRTTPQAYALGALGFLAYLVGSASAGLSQQAVSWFRRLADVVEWRVRATKGRLTRRMRYYLAGRRNIGAKRGLVMDAVNVRYTDAGFPGSASLTFPIEVVLDELESLALQLWHKAPTQYQEYDRLKAEVAFRTGIAVPLLAIAVAVGIQAAWWAGVLIGVGAIVLALQTRTLDFDREMLLVNALFQGLAESSVLRATIRELTAMKPKNNGDRVYWFSITAIALERAGAFEGSYSAIDQATSELGDTVDFDGDWPTAIRSNANAAVEVLEREAEGDLLPHFLRRLEDKIGSVLETDRAGLGEQSAELAGRRAWRDG